MTIQNPGLLSSPGFFAFQDGYDKPGERRDVSPPVDEPSTAAPFDPAKSAAAKGSYKIICTVTKPDEFAKYQPVFEQAAQSIRFE